MIRRTLAFLLCLTMLWSGASMAGQALASALGGSPQGVASTAALAANALAASPTGSGADQDLWTARALAEAAALAGGAPEAVPPGAPDAPEHDRSAPLGPTELPAGSALPLSDDRAAAQHSEPLFDTVALLEVPVSSGSVAWRSPRPQALADTLPCAPHLEGLRRPPRLACTRG